VKPRLPWRRATRREPCRVCGKADWCTWQEDGTACCMRVESGTEMRNGGWLHKPDAPVRYVPAPKPEPPRPRLPWAAMLAAWKRGTDPDRIHDLADRLGVAPDALEVTGCVWAADHRAWAWPMRTGGGLVCGVRLRSESGDKWAVRGSQQGLFLPWPMPARLRRVHVVEGPTDLCAALTIGLPAVGRPSCRGSEDALVRLLERLSAQEAVLVPDRDEPGQLGAAKLQETLPVRSVCWTPPAKDLREAVRNGLTSSMVDCAVRDLSWSEPKPTNQEETRTWDATSTDRAAPTAA